MNSTITIDPGTRSVIGEMIGHARVGRLDLARAAGKAGLDRAAQAGPIHALLGRMACESGDFDDGLVHLRAAIEALPDEVAVRCDLAAALVQVGDFEGVLDTCTLERNRADPSLQLARFRGYAAQQLERYSDAVEAYRYVVNKAPDDAGTWNNLGNAEAALGLNDQAVASLRRAVQLDPQAAPSRINLAGALASAGSGDQAIAELQRATRDFPDDPYSHYELGRLAGTLGNSRLSVDSLEIANRLKPNDVDILVKLAGQRGVDWDLDGAKQGYREALALVPNHPEAFIGLAMIVEQDNRADQLAVIAQEARAAGVEPGAQAMIDALHFRREKRWAEGLAAAEAASSQYDAIRRAQLIGECNDRLGRPAEAFAAFSEMNRLASEAPHGPLQLAELYRRMVSDNAATLTRPWVDSWTDAVPPAADEHASPAFLVGFPRSGTTLLDTMLMGHPRVRVLEEKPALVHVEQSIGGLDDLPPMTAEAIRAARDRYRAEAATYADIEHGTLLVDKSPLYLNKTAIIHRLFPDAQMVLALRHPMDVVLSCFVTNFRPNAAMSNFLDLSQAAELYDRSMAAFFAAKEVLGLPTYAVVYERMVADQEAELRPLFDWLGLDWHAGAADHQTTAAKRSPITTASYAQVHEPIYTRSAGRWVRYREQIGSIEPILAPWVERFGYSLDDPAKVPERRG
jgi:tetratricopeptide (TPR) repeat protein